MAVLIPFAPKKCPASERVVFQKLERELPDDWIVLHSLGLPGHETKIEGEADFVILCPYGIFVLEVKGGTVACHEGLWTYSGDFPTFTRKESPWNQAMTALGAVQNSLKYGDIRFKHTLFGYGVIMPAVRQPTCPPPSTNLAVSSNRSEGRSPNGGWSWLRNPEQGLFFEVLVAETR